MSRPFALPKATVIRPPRPFVGPQKYLESPSPWKVDNHDREIRDRPPRLVEDDIKSPLVPQMKSNPQTPSSGFRSRLLDLVAEEVDSPTITKHIPKEPEPERTITRQMSKKQAELDQKMNMFPSFL